MFALLPMGFAASAQVSHAKTETFHIVGNCNLCKQTIEAAGTKKGESVLVWDADVKREAYAALETCCQYERVPQADAVSEESTSTTPEHDGQQRSPIDTVLLSYFNLKDALVAGHADDAAAAATQLSKQLDKLSTPAAEQVNLQSLAIVKAKTLEDQRMRFATLSESIYQLTKSIHPSSPVYYQHCPMYNKGKGANWLSNEKAIRNPYYGEQMLTCGSVVETVNEKNTQTHKHE